MAIINYNLKQITNFTAEELKEQDAIDIVNDGEWEYYKFTTTHFGNLPMLKFGYICEPNAFNIPIYITFAGYTEPNKFTLGKTGIFEIQPEIFIDKNSAEQLEENIKFEITELRIPTGFSFSIDYITAAEANVKEA